MNKTYKIAFALFLLLVLSLAWLESTEPEPVNWSPSYTNMDKIPLGAYIFYESWEKLRPGKLEQVKIPPYEYLNSTPGNGTYFFLNDHVNFDEDELDDLLDWVTKGNTLFISAKSYGKKLQDTLQVEISAYTDASDGFRSRPAFNLVNPHLKLKDPAKFDQDIESVFFSKIDTLNQVVLGTSAFRKNTKEEVNFIRLNFGDGKILLHTAPQAFSNYFLLKNENHRYSEALLAYLNDENIFWDSYYKSGKSFYTSPLYILLNNRSLKWAYYFVIIAALLFIIFEGKRKQRAIPIVTPLQNRSYEFTQTMSHLYMEQKKFHELGLKKIALFKEYIRDRYRLDASQLNEDFYRDLAFKSENSLEDTKRLFEIIFNFQQRRQSIKEDYFNLSRSIQLFNKQHGTSGSE